MSASFTYSSVQGIPSATAIQIIVAVVDAGQAGSAVVAPQFVIPFAAIQGVVTTVTNQLVIAHAIIVFLRFSISPSASANR